MLRSQPGEEAKQTAGDERAPVVVVAAERVHALGMAVLHCAGAPAPPARTQIEQLVRADLCGRPSHGMQRLPTLVARIKSGVLDPAAKPVLRRANAAVAVDGRDGFGPPTAHAAVAELVVVAREVGTAVAAIRAAGHLGMLAPYVERLASAGLVGVALSSSEALVHPHGGRVPLIGTNPIAVGVPATPLPFVFDMATAAISAGEVMAVAERGGRLPEGRAVDHDGRPTTDPTAALAGALSPFGGAKGYGLALAIELLVATLSATALGRDVCGTLDTHKPVSKGDVLLAIDPRALTGSSDGDPVSAFLDELRRSPAAPGVPAVRIPGDRMRAERQLRLREGIPYPTQTWHRLLALERAAA